MTANAATVEKDEHGFDRRVCVIIAAHNAERTIARAIGSALGQSEVSEVMVVDDASQDGTVATARAQDDGTGRLKVIALTKNAGPAAARNVAIANSSAPYVAVLDADDFLLPGRFARIFAVPDWDIIADNIAFIAERDAETFSPDDLAQFPAAPLALDLATFIAGNISQPGKSRGELGFAKPVICRELLDRSGIRFHEQMRLGEDYALYAELVAAGARFVRVRCCGYVALVREGSLSGMHRTEDLAALLMFDDHLAQASGLDADASAALRKHRAQVASKVALRRLLDFRRQHGRWRASLWAARRPLILPGLIFGVLRDKLRNPARNAMAPAGGVRYLY